MDQTHSYPTEAFLEKRVTWNDLSLSVESIYFPPLETPEHKSEPSHRRFHYHDYIELIYMLDGEVWSAVGGQVYTLHKGDLLAVNSNSPHTFDWPYQREYICIKFQPELLYGDDESLLPLRYRLPLLFDDNGACIFPADSIRDLGLDVSFYTLVQEGQQKQFGFQMVMRGEVQRLFGLILRRSSKFVSTLPPRSETQIRKAIEYIDTHLTSITLEETASHCGLSYSYFSRTFHTVLQKSFSQYVLSRRLETAARMLGSTDLSVEEISYAVGFGSPSYFIARFREAKGMSPSRFRRALSGGME